MARYADLRTVLDTVPTWSGVLHWRSDEIEALWRDGQDDLARERLEALLPVVEVEGPWERATATRMAAVLGDPAEADGRFASAMTLHDQSCSSMERARTLLLWGEWLLRHGRANQATPQLREAADTFAQLRAAHWAARAEALLGEIGAAQSGELQVAPGDRTTVRAFGPLTLVRGDAEDRVGTDRAGRLLRYLVAMGGTAHSEQIIDEIWPDATAANGGPRLRNVLARVRRRYGPVVVRNGSTIRWADHVEVDAEVFTGLARQALTQRADPAAVTLARRAIGLYCDNLLPMEPYADWAVASRERMRQRYLALLDLLADEATTRGDLDEASFCMQQAIEGDPLDEMRYLRLATLLADHGHPDRARSLLAVAQRVVDDLGVAPSEQTTALQHRLVGWDRPRSRGTATPDRGRVR